MYYRNSCINIITRIIEVFAKVTSFNAKEVWDNLYVRYVNSKKKKKKPPAFKVGDKRRLNKKFRPFKKDTYLAGLKKCLWYAK